MIYDDEEYLTDSKGNIIKFSDGTPVPLDYFTQDPTDTFRIDNAGDRKKRIEAMLKAGNPVPEKLLFENGFVKSEDGDWTYEGRDE